MRPSIGLSSCKTYCFMILNYVSFLKLLQFPFCYFSKLFLDLDQIILAHRYHRIHQYLRVLDSFRRSIRTFRPPIWSAVTEFQFHCTNVEINIPTQTEGQTIHFCNRDCFLQNLTSIFSIILASVFLIRDWLCLWNHRQLMPVLLIFISELELHLHLDHHHHWNHRLRFLLQFLYFWIIFHIYLGPDSL